MDQTEDENTSVTAESNEKIVFRRSTLNRLKSDSKTPSKRKSRNTRACQSENRVRKSRKLSRTVIHNTDGFSVELLTEQLSTPQQSLAKDGDKLWQTCFVNLEHLTPNKLELVKTISSPLLQIKNEISNLNEAKGADTKAKDECVTDIKVEDDECVVDTKAEDECVADTKPKDECAADNCSFLLESNTICQDNDNTVIIEEKTLNDTFTLSPDENATMVAENLFSVDTDVDKNKIESTSPPLFSSLFENLTSNGAIPKKDASIVRKLSKTLKPTKSQRLSNNSKISKSLRLSSVTSGRTVKIPGSKAVQLYEFLTDEQCGSKQSEQVNLTDSPPSGCSTPKILKKHVINTLLKSTLKRHNNVTFQDAPNEENVMNKSRVKMPNFALIHQKRFEKMENISDYQDRKSERAKLLLSGGKLPVNWSNQSPKLKNETIKKELINCFNNKPSACTLPPPIQLVSPWRIETKGILKDANQNLTKPQSERKVKITLTSDKTPDTSSVGMTMRKTPFKAVSRQISTTKITSKEQTKPSTTKKAVEVGSNSNFRPNTVNQKPPLKEKTGRTRFGFRVPIKVSKNEIVKAVTNKTKLMATGAGDIDEKRAVIKGVRSNRRFDLLMKMRLEK